MAKILILNTGGTIGMTKTEDGYRPDGAWFRDTVGRMDSLKAAGMPAWDFMETVPLLDSSRMSVKEWNKIAGIIAERYDDYAGFVILHGTDTMAYTASALSFMLCGLSKPVILTGSQIPLCEIRSDGRDNLITSMIIAGEGKIREVCIYFGGILLRGNRATKYSADGMQAFVSPNYPPLATAGISIQYHESAFLQRRAEKFVCRRMSDVPIGVLKVFPGIPFRAFEPLLTETLRGLVLETFGSGNIPDDGGVLLPMLEKAKKHGTVVTVCSQCPQATVNVTAYEAGNALAKGGAVSGRDMTTEAAVTKLYYLFSVYDDAEIVKFNMERDVRGELTPRDDL
ncbi:MAG: type I asparaginase [Clostridia bacterium]|nr:type I asparaginase [Clostridia bacterium]